MILLPTLLLAAVPPPIDETLPSWLAYSNDSLPGTTRDDGRTAALAGQATFDRWVVAVDAAMLTDVGQNRRSDELMVTAGYELRGCRIGVGARLAADLGGEHVQIGWHEAIGSAPFRLAYEPSDWEPVLTWSTAWFASVRPTAQDRLFIAGTASAVVSPRRFQADTALVLGYGGPRRGAVFAGVAVREDTGATLTQTARHARGRAFAVGPCAGAQVEGLLFSVTWEHGGPLGTLTMPF